MATGAAGGTPGAPTPRSQRTRCHRRVCARAERETLEGNARGPAAFWRAWMDHDEALARRHPGQGVAAPRTRRVVADAGAAWWRRSNSSAATSTPAMRASMPGSKPVPCTSSCEPPSGSTSAVSTTSMVSAATSPWSVARVRGARSRRARWCSLCGWWCRPASGARRRGRPRAGRGVRGLASSMHGASRRYGGILTRGLHGFRYRPTCQT